MNNDFMFPNDFSDKVMGKIAMQVEARRRSKRIWTGILCSLAALAGAAGIIIALIQFKIITLTDFSPLSDISVHKSVISSLGSFFTSVGSTLSSYYPLIMIFLEAMILYFAADIFLFRKQRHKAA